MPGRSMTREATRIKVGPNEPLIICGARAILISEIVPVGDLAGTPAWHPGSKRKARGYFFFSVQLNIHFTPNLSVRWPK